MFDNADLAVQSSKVWMFKMLCSQAGIQHLILYINLFSLPKR